MYFVNKSLSRSEREIRKEEKIVYIHTYILSILSLIDIARDTLGIKSRKKYRTEDINEHTKTYDRNKAFHHIPCRIRVKYYILM